MCTKRRSNKIPITVIHEADYNLASIVLETPEAQEVIKEYLEISELENKDVHCFTYS